MKLEEMCVSLELSKKLKELGVKQDSYFYWTICNDCTKEYGSEEYSLQKGKEHGTNYAALTASELGVLIGETCNEWAQGYNDCYSQWVFRWGNRGSGSMIEGIGKSAFSNQEHEVNARAELLIHILDPENNPLSN